MEWLRRHCCAFPPVPGAVSFGRPSGDLAHEGREGAAIVFPSCIRRVTRSFSWMIDLSHLSVILYAWANNLRPLAAKSDIAVCMRSDKWGEQCSGAFQDETSHQMGGVLAA
jgi:hypothetical protein